MNNNVPWPLPKAPPADPEATPFIKGSGVWEGVVIIVRPPNPDERSLCRVASARTTQYNGKRAISAFEVPYSMVRHYFAAGDGQEVWVYGEFFARGDQPGHFEFYDKASQKEFFLTAGGAKRLYPSANRVV